MALPADLKDDLTDDRRVLDLDDLDTDAMRSMMESATVHPGTSVLLRRVMAVSRGRLGA